MLYKYDREGNIVGLEQWATLMEDEKYRRVARTDLSANVFVSTVWLGIDHGFGASRQPLVFETMVFRSGHGDDCWRYATEAEALAGHERVVVEVRAQLAKTS